jgi:hypothetical protein
MDRVFQIGILMFRAVSRWLWRLFKISIEHVICFNLLSSLSHCDSCFILFLELALLIIFVGGWSDKVFFCQINFITISERCSSVRFGGGELVELVGRKGAEMK